MKKKISLVFVLMVLLMMGGTMRVRAAENYFNQTEVKQNQWVENFFLYGKDGIISGEVSDDVIVINGNLTLTATAKVKDVFVIGGEINQEPGAKIRKGIYNINLGLEHLNTWLSYLVLFFTLEAVKFVLSIFILLVCFLAMLTVRRKVVQAKDSIRERLVSTGLLGLSTFIALLLLTAASLFAGWGIPVAIALGVLTIILAAVGLAGLSLIFGELLSASFSWGKSEIAQSFFGLLLIVTLINFPLAGLLWGFLVLLLGLGGAVRSFFPHKKNI